MAIKITDLVDQQAMQQLADLRTRFDDVKSKYVEVANALLGGLTIKVSVVGDLEKIDTLLRTTSKKLIDITKQHTAVVAEQQQVLTRTTATIADQLQKNAQYNASKRESTNVDKEAMQTAKELLSVYDQRMEEYVNLMRRESEARAAVSQLNKQYKDGAIQADAYEAQMVELQKTLRSLTAQKREVTKSMAVEERMNATASGSYNNLRQQLEFLKDALKGIPKDALADPAEQERVQRLRDAISDLVTELKYQGELMGEHQMNVGNYASAMGGAAVNVKEVDRYLEEYAIATQNGIASTDDINRVLAVNATTTEQMIAQNKALTTAIGQVDQTQAGASATIAEMNAKIEENKMKLLDIDNIMSSHAKTINEAEAQNKALAQAMGMLDVSTDEGKAKYEEYSQRIAENKQFLAEHTQGVIADSDAAAAQQAALEAVASAMATEATSIAEAQEQNRILEQAIRDVNVTEEDAIEKIDMYRSKQAQNDELIAKFNGTLMENKELYNQAENALKNNAATVSEAAAQNKILAEAIQNVNQHAKGAQQKINEYNAKIRENEAVINQSAKASDELANKLLSTVGVSGNFGNSLMSLGKLAGQGGNAFAGLSTKVSAFGKTCLGLLTNPYMLAFLGIAGVAAGVKWWYDYNKGLVEASRLTKYFTGLTGDSMKSVRDNVQAVADTFGKDFKETLRAANALAKNTGITVNEATDLIAKGFAAGGTNSEQFLSNLQRYAPTLEKAGMSADEMVASLSQIDKAGTNSTRSLTAMGKASLQLRVMNNSTAESLKGIGIDADQMSKDLQNGSITVTEALSQVAAKLQETGTTSQEAATVMKELFGARGESAIGDGFIEFLASGNQGLEELLGKADSFQRLKLQEVETNKELDDIVASLFDTTGGGFESATTKCKIWIKQGLIAAIKWVVNLINYFIDWYNESLLVRGIVNAITNSFKIMWEVVKLVANLIIDAVKSLGRQLHALGDIVEGVFTLDPKKVMKGWNDLGKNFGDTWKEMGADALTAGKNIANSWLDGVNSTLNPQKIKHIDVNSIGSADTGSSSVGKGGKGNGGRNRESSSLGGKNASSTGKARVDDENKAALEQLKILEQLNASTIELMDDGIEKTLAKIQLEYKKKVDAIKGNSANEQALRINLAKEMSNKLAQAQAQYDANRLKIDTQNRLAAVEAGSKEEYDIKKKQLEEQYNEEVANAKKTGADVNLIKDKYVKLFNELNQKYNKKRLDELAEDAATEQIIRDNALQTELTALKNQQDEEIKSVDGNEKKIAAIKDKYARLSVEKQEQYAIETAKRQMEAYKKQVNMLKGDNGAFDALFGDEESLMDVGANTQILEGIGLAHEEALNMAKNLAKAQLAIANAEADGEIAAISRIVDADVAAREERIKNAEKWLNRAAEACSNITDLVSTLFDGQISKLEEQEEALTDYHDNEMERIETQADQGQITEEEAEIRKRAVEAETERKEEELAKKKAKLQYKQAVAEKANNIAQIAISTALGIMKTFAELGWPVGIPGAAFVAAMGAIQTATALAQPIKAYAKGTDHHPGGLAVVGDAGKKELVESRGKWWITPDVPTLMSLPQGAKVYPDYMEELERMANEPPEDYFKLLASVPLPDITPLVRASLMPQQVIVNNDYRDLKREMAENNRLLKFMLKQQRSIAKQEKYDRYRAERI